MITFLIVLLFGVPFTLFEGWLFMMLLRLTHNDILPAVIPAGYWPCLLFAVVGTTLVSTISAEGRLSRRIASD